MIVFILLFADRGPKEDDEAFVAEVWEICRQIHHHSRLHHSHYITAVVDKTV